MDSRYEQLIRRSIAVASIQLLGNFNYEDNFRMVGNLMPVYVEVDDDQHMRVMMARNIVAVQIAGGQQYTKDRRVNIVA